MIDSERSWPWWRWALTGLSTLALTLSAYLSWHQLMGGSVIGCGGGSPCEQVLSSRWSSLAGVFPVGGLAVGAYLALWVASLFIGPAIEPSVRQFAWKAVLVLAGAVAGSAVWFIILQKWVIGSFCAYCMATHITGLLLAALVSWRAFRQLDKPEARNPGFETNSEFGEPRLKTRVGGSFRAFGTWISLGLALAGILATCQIVIEPPPASRAGESRNRLPALDPRAVPLVGSPDASHVVTLLFDYQCPHCQQLHFMLEAAIQHFDGQLAFALCPTPLSTHCNPYIPGDVEAYRDSCDLAKVGLAVWVAKREAFREFNRWMFSFESGDRWHPRSLGAARAKAAELAGQAEFDLALSDPWVGRHLQMSVQVFGSAGGGAVPKLVYGSRWVLPQPNDADDLVSILQESLMVASVPRGTRFPVARATQQ